MRLRFFVMLALVGLVLGGVFGFKWFIGEQIDAFFDSMPLPTVTITAAEAETQRWPEEIHSIGSLAPVRGTRLAFETSGLVRSISFENGQQVAEGAVLVELDTDTDRADLARLEAEFRLAERELARARRLIGENNISQADLQRREADFEASGAAVRAQNARIEQKTLLAPFSGQLGLRQVEVGQFVGAGEVIVDLVDLSRLHVNFSVTEAELARLAIGTPVTLRVTGAEDRLTAAITAIAPRLRAASRTGEVQATLDNPGTLRPDQFARVTIQIGEPQEVVTVPQSAIRFNPYGNSVFVINEDDDGQLSVQERFVTTGSRRGNDIAVIDNLDVGERIASSGLLKLQNDTPVTISEDADPQNAAERRHR
ncbi:MAG: efflux RND transporter periplasmic adaptor subunit [Thioalkalivibrionaceae bacterium]